ncbi:flagellar hook-basal body complex protein FliE [Dermatophilus congolensis]|uniref:flagellar hook-basal body complex protein FliE n=1 Tax=Dermatophilus congolensis TaxID=1863 RepID=UPI001AAE9CE4|nr:flagellar hook-basal body complex protein FliE [Dermatophilus congolensis]MBO3130001.1 flagellar hook-basal body complex protein FliE [Dermatophilus congolensis]MBO3131369.1 flagellar hook-basal body complex protein FliE [Dermatophilus congolensis]MBO3134475.1 flagellar hook-basal body complex protein FliE [Dermatophilus congolensis]MBO3136710.1 flagellar hook-basal body complex protein FliE [Dermatophilus congolensis]MBO3138955.1 flagellar hook-basal body complex protein FliE [Dermatophilu
MSIAPIPPSVGFGVTPGFGINPAYGVSATLPTTPSALRDPDSVSGPSFGQMLAQKIDQLNAMHLRTDELARAAATGDLKDVHEYTIAAAEAGVATQLAVAVRNKGLEAFNEIMRMQL